MARSKSKTQIVLEYYPLKGLYRLLGILPWDWSVLICRSILRSILACLPKRRTIIDENLSLAFPDLSPESRRHIAANSLLSVSRCITMIAKISRLDPKEWEDLVRVEGLEHVQAALSGGRGAITFTAHYGCWEAMGAYLPRFVKSAFVVRPMDNPRIEALMTSVRTTGGGLVIPRRRALSEGLRVLRRNTLLGILVDQNFAQGHLFVNFLGQPAATTPVVPLLARRIGCPILPLHNVWENGHIRIIFDPPLTLSLEKDRELAMAEDTQAISQIVEGWIRKDPGQWLWLHNRWKRKPQPGEFVYMPDSSGLTRQAEVSASEPNVQQRWSPQQNHGIVDLNAQIPAHFYALHI